MSLNFCRQVSSGDSVQKTVLANVANNIPDKAFKHNYLISSFYFIHCRRRLPPLIWQNTARFKTNWKTLRRGPTLLKAPCRNSAPRTEAPSLLAAQAVAQLYVSMIPIVLINLLPLGSVVSHLLFVSRDRKTIGCESEVFILRQSNYITKLMHASIGWSPTFPSRSIMIFSVDSILLECSLYKAAMLFN